MAAPFNNHLGTDPVPFGAEGVLCGGGACGQFERFIDAADQHAFIETPHDLATFSSSLRVVSASGPGDLLLAGVRVRRGNTSALRVRLRGACA